MGHGWEECSNSIYMPDFIDAIYQGHHLWEREASLASLMSTSSVVLEPNREVQCFCQLDLLDVPAVVKWRDYLPGQNAQEFYLGEACPCGKTLLNPL